VATADRQLDPAHDYGGSGRREAELLDVVNAERERSSGPAMRPMTEMTPAATGVAA